MKGRCMEYVIYADESDKSGKYYSNFYGGALVRSSDLQPVVELLRKTKELNGLGAEAKWSKVTSQYLDRYIKLMAVFFDLVERNRVKVRVMFTQNANVPTNLTRAQRENEYFLLYYQFIKHAFGLQYSNPGKDEIGLRIYLDRLPDTREKVKNFRGYLCGLDQNPQFQQARIRLRPDQIAEVDSKAHEVLQCADIVLGAMQFRLNDKHKRKPPGQKRRGKNTIAKEKLYKFIGSRIRRVYPNFNIGISTGTQGDHANRWAHPYRHWLFVPRDSRRDNSMTKP